MHFRDVKAVNNISFTFKRGELFGYLDTVCDTFAGLPRKAITGYAELTGMNLEVGTRVFTPWIQFVLMFGGGVIFIILSEVMRNKKNVRDR